MSRPVLAQLLLQSHPAVPERDKSGERLQSVSSSKTNVGSGSLYLLTMLYNCHMVKLNEAKVIWTSTDITRQR